MWYKKVLAQSTGYGLAQSDKPLETLQELIATYPQLKEMNEQQIAQFIHSYLNDNISPTDVQKLLRMLPNSNNPEEIPMEAKLDHLGLRQQHQNIKLNPEGVPHDHSPMLVQNGIQVLQSASNNIENAQLPANKTFVGTTVG